DLFGLDPSGSVPRLRESSDVALVDPESLRGELHGRELAVPDEPVDDLVGDLEDLGGLPNPEHPGARARLAHPGRIRLAVESVEYCRTSLRLSSLGVILAP